MKCEIKPLSDVLIFIIKNKKDVSYTCTFNSLWNRSLKLIRNVFATFCESLAGSHSFFMSAFAFRKHFVEDFI